MRDDVLFTAETNLAEALDRDPAIEEAFRKLGLKCPDCAAASVENLRDAARYHGKNLEEILTVLRSVKLSGS